MLSREYWQREGLPLGDFRYQLPQCAFSNGRVTAVPQCHRATFLTNTRGNDASPYSVALLLTLIAACDGGPSDSDFEADVSKHSDEVIEAETGVNDDNFEMGQHRSRDHCKFVLGQCCREVHEVRLRPESKVVAV
jgi:hypothetical protein